MRRSLILAISVLSFFMFLQLGCEQQAKETKQPLKVEEPKEKEINLIYLPF